MSLSCAQSVRIKEKKRVYEEIYNVKKKVPLEYQAKCPDSGSYVVIGYMTQKCSGSNYCNASYI